jgi:uncharacterized protein (DUF39 family)
VTSHTKTISFINKKIEDGKAVILTETEFLEEIRKGYRFKLSDVDVVTTAFHAETSGTAAMLVVPVAERGIFTRAKRIWLNGVLGFPGPAPNERLGLVDTLIFADRVADDERGNYSGAELIAGIVNREKIQVECLSVEGDTYESSFTLDQVEFARMYVYNSFINRFYAENQTSLKTSHLKTIRAGTKILLNRAKGIVIGCGTRSAPQCRSLSFAADMFEMAPECMRQSETDRGMSIINSVTLAIPVLTEDILNDFADCLMEGRHREFERSAFNLEEALAEYLKRLIETGEFLLTSSDMNLNNWFQN